MKCLFTIIALSFQLISFSQASESPVEVTPTIEKKIRQEVNKDVAKFKQKLKEKREANLVIEFAVDTFSIEKYMEKYMAYDYSTVGMRAASYEATYRYDSLMNKYYKKLLATLKTEDKKFLILAQKAWISFRDSELKLIETISKDEYSGGGTMQQLIDTSSYLDIIKRRTIEIFEHLQRATQDY